ncbi:DUF3426 domain-containing protein [Arenimonas daejeonensis]|uniref:DUF3426 domain-containing protein n=1 Tax=Arenimonas daejeonensis TaxID=370777 RepID=UPI0013156E83|nr:DUF3426 domain-containing protein [Arenimonas daejeonensis]
MALAIALLLQLVLADRYRLAGDASWRPRLETMCAALGCDLPPWHEPDAFRVTNREVQPHPKVPGVLLITTSFRNDARWPQAWPVMEVSLQDLDGQSLGLRRFQPVEYLGSPPASSLIAPGQSAVATWRSSTRENARSPSPSTSTESDIPPLSGRTVRTAFWIDVDCLPPSTTDGSAGKRAINHGACTE